MYLVCTKSCRIVAGAAFLATLASAPAAFATTEIEAPASALSPRGEALKVALAAPVSEAVRTHYANEGYRGVWLSPEGDDKRATDLLAALENAGSHGLSPSRYDIPALRAAVAAAMAEEPAAVAAAELKLTRAFLDYASDVRSGILDPRSVDRELHVDPERPDGAVMLREIAAAASAADYLEALAPAKAEYGRLQEKLARLSALPAGAWGDEVPGGPSIRLGEKSRRVEAMRARLTALGDHTPAPAAGGAEPAPLDVYDVALEDSVRAFQRRHGLNDDGVAGRRTIDAMNVSIEDRIGQTLVALERLRWMNRDLGHRHVYVNQADFTVQLKEGDQILFSERVVVGKARKHRTPEFSDEMTHMVFNPVWHVPNSIATEEILPKLQADPEYLLKKNMRLVARGGGETPDPATTDWTLYSASDFPFRVKQRSGGGNALGRVKFMFPNQFSIYLHDTPSKRLFKKDARAFSHGCVRVQDPFAFARALLGPQEDDPAAFVDRMLARSGERRVNLQTPVPVHLTYLTAWVDDEGVSQFRDDVYGRDARILGALQAKGVEVSGAGG